MKIIQAGERFGRLVTVSDAGRAKDGHRIWLCRCDCGQSARRQTNTLRGAGLKSCGCVNGEAQRIHGHRGSARGGTATYRSWQSALRRCHSPDSKDFYRYGGKGVEVCVAWRNDFTKFLSDMGERPSGTSLDRWPNPSGNYEPGNCRWATPTEQARNRCNTTWTEFRGEFMPVAEVADRLGISVASAGLRLKRGKLHASI